MTAYRGFEGDSKMSGDKHERLLKSCMGSLPLLPDEDEDEYYELYDEINAFAKPQNSMQEFDVYHATTFAWELLRYQRLKIEIIRNNERAAVEQLTSSISVGPNKSLQAFAKMEAEKYFTCAEADEEIKMKLLKNGYSEHTVRTIAYQQSLPSLAMIERLITNAQKRLATHFKEMERRSLELASRKAPQVIAKARAAPQESANTGDHPANDNSESSKIDVNGNSTSD